MYVQIGAALCIGWIVLFEILKRTVFPKILNRQEELQMEYEMESAFGLLPKCEVCGQEEHTTEEHYTRNSSGFYDEQRLH